MRERHRLPPRRQAEVARADPYVDEPLCQPALEVDADVAAERRRVRRAHRQHEVASAPAAHLVGELPDVAHQPRHQSPLGGRGHAPLRHALEQYAVAVEVELDAVHVVVLEELPDEATHLVPHEPAGEVHAAPVTAALPVEVRVGRAERPHKTFGMLLLEPGEERVVAAPGRGAGVVLVVHADRDEYLEVVRAAEGRGHLKRIRAEVEEVLRRVPRRLHAMVLLRDRTRQRLAGLAAGEVSEPGALRTVRDRRDARAERMDEAAAREVLHRHRQVRGPVEDVAAVRVVDESARPRQGGRLQGGVVPVARRAASARRAAAECRRQQCPRPPHDHTPLLMFPKP